MSAHVLACATFCDPSSSNGLNGAGTFVAWVIGIIIGLCVVIAVIRGLLGALGVKTVRNDPVTPPWLREVATGYRTPAFTAPVRAVTPAGTMVRQGRCCVAGHQVPEQATRHAAMIAARIRRTGR